MLEYPLTGHVITVYHILLSGLIIDGKAFTQSQINFIPFVSVLSPLFLLHFLKEVVCSPQ